VAATLGLETGDTYALNLCLDTVNNRFKCPRHSSFSFIGNLVLSASVTVSSATVGAAITRNSSSSIYTVPPSLVELPYLVGQAQQQIGCAMTTSMNVGDYVNLIGRIYNGTIATPVFLYSGAAYIPSLSYLEIPLW
jgi:flavin reductase (DIM6/NTAB) family NADH-FMN oxidoreductase RutF